ncbi:hypothetical protein L1987_24029 [Smallanthus sonchifolius]|uniref:Uncharacterized protein n=1 Tax=Smallanthus sonchifolius TaxID=185202 RepID=A0ACB9IJ31_9ASTR|nr:hypothetical protein L1987_24029 [Smallanthus sonchifolius]
MVVQLGGKGVTTVIKGITVILEVGIVLCEGTVLEVTMVYVGACALLSAVLEVGIDGYEKAQNWCPTKTELRLIMAWSQVTSDAIPTSLMCAIASEAKKASEASTSGQINKKRISKLQSVGILESTGSESFDICESCLNGKITRAPFTGTSERTSDLLGLIHTDVFQNKVEIQLGKKIKAIRSDRGGEYLSYEFGEHLKGCGIIS